MRGLFVGLTTIDVQYLVDTFPPANSKTVARAFTMTTGGPAANAAITFAHLGGESHLVSQVGSHQFTSFIDHELSSYNVTLTDLTRASSDPPAVSSIITTRGTGDRAVMTTASPQRPADGARQLSLNLKNEGYRVLLVDGFHMDVCRDAAEQAHQLRIPVVLDGGSWKPGMETLLPHVDVAICAESFQPPLLMGQQTALEYLARQGVTHRAITRGERPIVYSAGDASGEIPIERIEATDTLGAGDILHGAFCYFFALGDTFERALARAASVATRSCQSFGTRAWMGG
ncbi:MAG TPA: PfkB family carbohydrate kinase [Ktedonobacterales bacterium]